MAAIQRRYRIASHPASAPKRRTPGGNQTLPSFSKLAPEIVITGQRLESVSAEAVHALATGNVPPTIFQRSGPGRVQQGREGPSDNLALGSKYRAYELRRVADFFRNRKGETG